MNSITSVSKIEANRNNAQKSTGPEDTSTTRLNALKHGLLSKEVCFSGEDQQEFENFRVEFLEDLMPQGELEAILADRVITSAWRLKRAIKFEKSRIELTYKSLRSRWDEDNAWTGIFLNGNDQKLLNLTRYETTIEKQFYRALHELQRIQAKRKGEEVALPVAVDVDVSTQP